MGLPPSMRLATPDCLYDRLRLLPRYKDFCP